MQAMEREVEKVVASVEQGEGRGARVKRSVGRKELRRLDPFLLLDEFSVRHPAGFPEHPHRGIQTITYMLKGSFRHQDSGGHEGVIHQGDLQSLRAGRGVVHSEMPASEGDNTGLQLWVNLPRVHKMVELAYQDVRASDVPEVTVEGATIRVLAGEAEGVKSPLQTLTPIRYLAFHQQPGAKVTHNLPRDWNAFIYVITGTVAVGRGEEAREGGPHHTLVLGRGEAVTVCTVGPQKAHFVLVAGQPIGEPVVQSGPFVMNTQEEIDQAYQDFEMGRNGFEFSHKHRR